MSVFGQRFQSPAWVFRRKSENINACKFCIFAGQLENRSIQRCKVKDWTFRFQKTNCTCLIMTSNARNNRKNGRSKFLEKVKLAIPTKWDKSCGMMGQNQKNSCVRYFSCCVNVSAFLSAISVNLTKIWLQNLYVYLKLSEARFVFVLRCP